MIHGARDRIARSIESRDVNGDDLQSGGGKLGYIAPRAGFGHLGRCADLDHLVVDLRHGDHQAHDFKVVNCLNQNALSRRTGVSRKVNIRDDGWITKVGVGEIAGALPLEFACLLVRRVKLRFLPGRSNVGNRSSEGVLIGEFAFAERRAPDWTPPDLDLPVLGPRKDQTAEFAVEKSNDFVCVQLCYTFRCSLLSPV